MSDILLGIFVFLKYLTLQCEQCKFLTLLKDCKEITSIIHLKCVKLTHVSNCLAKINKRIKLYYKNLHARQKHSIY